MRAAGRKTETPAQIGTVNEKMPQPHGQGISIK